MRKELVFLILGILLASLATSEVWGKTERFSITRSEALKLDKKGVPTAAPSAAVDKVAYTYQRKAIAKIRKLLNARKSSGQVPVLLHRLARMQIETADVAFRIAHAEAYFEKKPIQLRNYHRVLRESVSTLDRYVRNYPHLSKIADVYRMRAKAFGELGEKAQAIQDYLTLIEKYPKYEQIYTAYLALAEYAEQDQDYSKAIGYLRKVLESKVDPEYPYALFKLAWDHYRLDQIDTAFRYVGEYVDYYNQRIDSEDVSARLAVSGQFLRDDLVIESVVFFLRGLEMKLPRYQIAGALDFFRRIARGPSSDEAYGKMLVRFTKLLRSHGQEAALVVWKDHVLEREKERPDAIKVVILVYEDQMNRYRYRRMLDSAQDLATVYDIHQDQIDFENARALVLASADRIQKSLSKEKKKSKGLSLVLAGVYQAFLKIVDPEDPRMYRVRFNIAEAFSSAGKSRQAIKHYQWVMKHGEEGPEGAIAPETVVRAGMSAITLRYQGFKEKNRVPENLQPKMLSEDREKGVAKDLAQWIAWMKWAEDRDPKNSDLPFYLYEANRILYSESHVQVAVSRMLKFVERYPESAQAVPAAQLVLDTMIKNENWERTHRLARKFFKIPAWGKRKKLRGNFVKVAANAYYKRGEQLFNSGKYADVLSRSAVFEKNYLKSKRKADWLNLVGRSALALNRDEKTVYYFSKLLKEAPRSEYVESVLLSRADLFEKRFKFELAARDYTQYLSVKKTKVDETQKMAIRRKILLLTWLAGDSKVLSQRISNRKICVAALKVQCDQYRALGHLSQLEGTPKSRREAARRLKQAMPIASRALWSLVMLEVSPQVVPRSRIRHLKNVMNGWAKIDPLVQYALLPRLSVLIPTNFEVLRVELGGRFPVRPDEESISARVGGIQEIEALGTVALGLPFKRIQASVLNEIAGMYADLGRDLKTLRPSGDVTPEEAQAFRETLTEVAAPFDQTSSKIRTEAFQLASASGLEDSTFQIIARPYLDQNPKVKKTLLPSGEFGASKTIGFEALELVDSDRNWKKPKPDPLQKKSYLQNHWVRAVKARNWSKVAYFLHVAQEDQQVEEGVLGVMKAISLASAGARAEGLEELEKSRKAMADDSARRYLLTKLIQIYLNTLAAGKIKGYLAQVEDLRRDVPLSEEEVFLVSQISGVAVK